MSFEDRAQEHEAAEWLLINRPRPGQRVFQPTDPGYGDAECRHCADDVPAGRRALGYSLCVSCAAAAEKRSGRFR